MNGVMTMDMLPLGSAARVAALSGEDGMRRRLQDIGFIEGTCVERVQDGPLGDPAAYRVRGAVIALRRQDAATIYVRS